MTNKFPILGIIRNAPDTGFEDGSCNELINMRYKDNAWRPVGKKYEAFTGIREFDVCHIHTIDEFKVFLGYDYVTGIIRYAINRPPSDLDKSISLGNFRNVRFTSIGNTLQIDVWNNEFTTVQTYYVVYVRNNGAYTNLLDLNFDPLKISFYPSTFGDYPKPAGVTEVTKMSFGGNDIYLGTADGVVYYWQYVISSYKRIIYNQTKLMSSAGVTQFLFDSRSGYEDVLAVRHGSDSFFRWDTTTKKFKTYYPSTTPKLEALKRFVMNSIEFHGEGTADSHNLAFAAALNVATEKAKEVGQFEGFLMVCYALRLFDGSYIKHSMPELVYVGNKAPSVKFYDDGSYLNYRLEPFEFGNILYDILRSEQTIIGRLQQLKDIVKSVDIFITKPITLLDISKTFVTNLALGGDHCEFSNPTPYANLNYKTVVEQGVFYKIHTISVEKLIPITGASTQTGIPTSKSITNLDYTQNLNDINNIASFEYLPVDNFTHHCKVGKECWVYNKRIFKGNTMTKLFKGFGLEYMVSRPNARLQNYTKEFVIEVELNTEDGLKTVHSNHWFTVDNKLTLPEVISYPDSRAKIMRILIKDGNVFRLIATLALTPHPFLNISYFINPNSLSVLLKKLDDISIQGNPSIVNFNVSLLPTFPVKSVNINDMVFNTNEVQVSEVNNPFFFPAKNSYQVGDGAILKMVSNTLPISQGQYGQHPVLVATTKGWWALNIAGGEVFIGSITPLNGSVCTSPSTVAYVDSTVVFASREGLMMLNGTQAVNISPQLCIQPSIHIDDIANFAKFTNDPSLVQVNNFSTDDFRDYLKYNDATHVCYDAYHREILVSNTHYSYSYVYSLNAKAWTKVNTVYSQFIFDYPDVYAVGQNNTLIQINKETHSDNQEVVMVSQPIKLGTNAFKKFERLVLKCSVNEADGKYFGFYLFLSQDGREWVFADGKQVQGQFNNLILQRSLTFKEAIIVIAGNINQESFITGFEYSAVEKLGNKLR